MKKILVPTDFSDNAQKALDYALKLAQVFDSELCLVHTYKLIQRAGTFIAIEQQMREDAKREMAKLVAKYERQKPIQSRVIKDTPIRGIGRVAKSYQADLIVMGTKGASGLSELFIGSTTNGLIKHTRIPVLAVPQAAEFKPHQQIVFAMDQKAISQPSVLAIMRALANAWQAKVEVVQILVHNKSGSIHESFKKAMEGLDHELHFIPHNESVNDGITEYLQQHSADLLCLIKRHRSFLQELFHNSVTQKEAFHSELPLLVLHDKN
ncbi:MAG: universal stress protein [Bacteroidota bacterium]